MTRAEGDRRLFVYGTLLEGERDHRLLDGRQPVGACSTEPSFQLVDLGAYAAMVAGGSTSVAGELYLVDRQTLVEIDLVREVPILFKRVLIPLGDGSQAETYVMDVDQVRGKRRLNHGDWRRRFTGDVQPFASPFARWARGRSSR